VVVPAVGRHCLAGQPPSSSHLQFFLRTGYMPPPAPVPHIDPPHEAYLA